MLFISLSFLKLVFKMDNEDCQNILRQKKPKQTVSDFLVGNNCLQMFYLAIFVI